MEQPALIPHDATLKHAATIALNEDMGIMLDYYHPSMGRLCKLVKTQKGETILYKSDEEYTSPLKRVFQIDGSSNEHGAKDIICISQNSIYIVHSNILASE